MKFNFELYPNFDDTDGQWFAWIICDIILFVLMLFIGFLR